MDEHHSALECEGLGRLTIFRGATAVIPQIYTTERYLIRRFRFEPYIPGDIVCKLGQCNDVELVFTGLEDKGKAYENN